MRQDTVVREPNRRERGPIKLVDGMQEYLYDAGLTGMNWMGAPKQNTNWVSPGWKVWVVAAIGFFSFGDLRADEWSRTITLQIAADSDFRKRPGWESEIQKSVDAVSEIWARHFGIRWKVVDFVPWDPPVGEKGLDTGVLFSHLKSTIPRSNADVVLGVFEGKCLDELAGSGDFFGTSALVITRCLRQAGPRNTVDMVLSHELAHLFGAFHVRPHIRSVMSGDGPDVFDPQTQRVIRLMRDMEFKRPVGAIHDLPDDKKAAISAIFAEGHLRGTPNPLAVAYLLSADFLSQNQSYAEAVEALNKALQIDAEWSSIHTALGITYEKMEKPDLAFSAYKAALSKDPADSRANERLAYLKILRGDERAVVGHLAAAAKSDPRSANLRNNLGLGYLIQGKLREAEVEFREALRLDPDTPDVRSNLAVALGRQGRHDESARVLREALRINPADIMVQANLGYTLELMGDTKGALDAYRKAQAMDPANRTIQINLGRLLKRTNARKANTP